MTWRSALAILFYLLPILAVSVSAFAQVGGYFTNVRRLGPEVNLPGANQNHPHSRDGLRLYFNSNRPGGLGGNDIHVAIRERRVDDDGNPVPFTIVENLREVNSPAADGGPCLSADGLIMVLNSQREDGIGQNDIWIATRSSTDEPFSEPVNLGMPINDVEQDFGPALSADGLTLLFASGIARPGQIGEFDIYRSKRASVTDSFGEVENLGRGVNSSQNDGNPSLSSDNLALFFASSRGGFNQLYVATRTELEAPFGNPTKLSGAVNSNTNETMCSISSDWPASGAVLYFRSDRDGERAIYEATWVQAGLQLPGDANQDGDFNVADAISLFGFLFSGEPAELPCGDGTATDEGNVLLLDHNGDERIDIADGVASLMRIFDDGPAHSLVVTGQDPCVPIAGCPETACGTGGAKEEFDGTARVLRTEPDVLIPEDERPVVDPHESTLTIDASGIEVAVRTSGLEPGHTYTAWWIIDQPDKLRENGRPVDIAMFAGAGGVVDDNGQTEFTAALDFGEIPPVDRAIVRGRPEDGLFDDPDATIKVFLRTHGPFQSGLEQTTTFGGGCSNNTSPDDGPPGDFECFDNQEVIFPRS